MPSETLEALNLNYPGEADGNSESVAALAGRTKWDSLLTVLQRSMDSVDRVTRIKLPSVYVRHEAEGQSQEWERDPRCPKRRKENCANDGRQLDGVGLWSSRVHPASEGLARISPSPPQVRTGFHKGRVPGV